MQKAVILRITIACTPLLAATTSLRRTNPPPTSTPSVKEHSISVAYCTLISSLFTGQPHTANSA